MRQLLTLYLILLLAAPLAACNADAETEGDADWFIEENALTLNEDLHVSETDDFFIGSADGLAVRDDGRIYVADGEESHVKVLSHEGELLEMIGRPGEGPGEFERPAQIDLARGDSIFVFDGNRNQISVFSSDHEFAYSLRIQGAFLATHTAMILDDGSYLIVQAPLAREVAQDGKPYHVRAVNTDGLVGDTLFDAPSSQMVMSNNERAFFFVPFARESHFLLGPDDHIHLAYGDSLGAFIYDRRGELQEKVSVPFDPVPVRNAALELTLADWSSHMRSVVEPEIPETKPAFTSFAMDDQERYWFKRPTEDPEIVDWWIVNAGERRILTASAPAHIDFSVIQNGYAYGTIAGGDELPAVVRYRITE